MYCNQGDNEQSEEYDPRASCAHLKPFREEQRRDQVDRNYRRERETDDVFVAHSFSTSFCAMPRTANTATVSRT